MKIRLSACLCIVEGYVISDSGSWFFQLNSLLHIKSIVIMLALCTCGHLAAEVAPEELQPDDVTGNQVDNLTGKRLFFKSSERSTMNETSKKADRLRKDSEFKNNQPGAGVLSEKTITAGKSENSDKASIRSSVRLLRYEANIKSADAVTVIINGHACELLELAGFRFQALGEQVMNCPNSGLTGLDIVLQDDLKSLKVLEGARALGVLLPGQSL